MRIAMSLAGAAVAGAIAWFAAGQVLDRGARQRAADRWADLEKCLLGTAVASGDRPSVRLRAISLAADERAGADESDWPLRCRPYAAALDAALGAEGVRAKVDPLPAAATALGDPSLPTAATGALDALWEGLRRADLPLGHARDEVVAAPAVTVPLLRAADLTSLGATPELGAVVVDLDPVGGGGSPRLLFGAEPLELCHLEADEGGAPWTRLRCTRTGVAMSGAGLGLVRGAPGAPPLLWQQRSERAQLFDATSGQPIWQAQTTRAQALLMAGTTPAVLYARRGPREAGAQWRLVWLAPGRPPTNRRVDLRPGAEAMLLAGELVVWAPEKGAEAGAQACSRALDGDGKLGPAVPIGTLPAASRYLGECASRDGSAVLLGTSDSPPRYSALLRHAARRSLVSIGVIDGAVQLSCHEGALLLSRTRARRLELWRCDHDGCARSQSAPLGMLRDLVVAAPLGDRAAVAWRDRAGALRLRVGSPAELGQRRDEVLLGPPDRGGLAVRALRLLASDGLGLLLVQDARRQLYAVRLDRHGGARAVGVSRQSPP